MGVEKVSMMPAQPKPLPNRLAGPYYGSMKRRFIVGLVLVPSLALALWAEGPDEQYGRVYSLIREGDVFLERGLNREALVQYFNARELLEKLHKDYPAWNQNVVAYRLSYLGGRIGTNVPPVLSGTNVPPPVLAPSGSSTRVVTSAPAAVPSVVVPAPVLPRVAVPSAPAKPVATMEARLQELVAEIERLRQDRELLQAKLREALSVQPAAVDPRELAQAEKRVQELERQNQELRASLDAEKERKAAAVDPAVLAQTQEALKEAQAALDRQVRMVTALTKEKGAIEEKLDKANERARARARTAERKVEPVAPAAAVSSEASVAELKEQVGQLQVQLDEERRRAVILGAENEALAKRLEQVVPGGGGARAPLAVAASGSPEPTRPVLSAKAAKAAKAAEKSQIKALQRERDDLRRRVAKMSNELEERRLRTGPSQQARLAEEVSILRARIQVYEARQVPFTAEELARYKSRVQAFPGTEASRTRRSPRQVPAGAATLVAEAERAIQGRRYEEAERKLQQALVLDERNVGLLVNLAVAHIEQNRLDAADETLKRAAASDPNDTDVLALTGMVRFRQGRYDEAFDTLSRAAQLDPDSPQTQNYLGLALIQKGQRGPAETALRRAVQLAPGYSDAHNNLAMLYQQAKPPYLELARWHYEKALSTGAERDLGFEKLLAPPAGTDTP